MSEYLHIKFTIPEDLGLKMKNIRAVKQIFIYVKNTI